MSEKISLPAATGERLAEYNRRMAELQTAVQVTVATAGELLDVPKSWTFSIEDMAFVAPPAQPEPAAADPTAEAA